jgi:hypothetical protein
MATYCNRFNIRGRLARLFAIPLREQGAQETGLIGAGRVDLEGDTGDRVARLEGLEQTGLEKPGRAQRLQPTEAGRIAVAAPNPDFSP